MKYIPYKGLLGNLTVLIDENKIKKIIFGQKTEDSEINDDPGAGISIMSELDGYFSGLNKEFTIQTEPEGTEFQKMVWKSISEIPYGETRTYSEIARDIGRPKSARAVGGACNKNPIPIIIPCHRVVGAKGKLTGYAGGIELKKKLLELEKNN